MLRKVSCILLFILISVSVCYGKTIDFEETQKVKFEKDVVHTYTHTQTGLKVTWIQNKDAIKSFTLGVKTPTVDSTGVNHIIEHTIFTGSKKYAAPSLFFDADSMYPNTFMNALTSGDMTLFPFATPYMPCYKALLDIYLDSIFNPDLLNQPYGFYEEAFNYNPKEAHCGGVVYNEMKGAYSNLERRVHRCIREVIYAGTPYAYDSGGNPNEIPTLTYEDFRNTYRRYYDPGNMKIILYGDVPIEESLALIGSYLANYQEARPEISLKVAPKSLPEAVQCNILNDGEKGGVVKSFVLGTPLTSEEEVAMDLWLNAFLVSPTSVFQQRLKTAGYYDVKVMKDDDLPYPVYSVVVGDLPLEALSECSQTLDGLFNQFYLRSDEEENLRDMLTQAKWQKLETEQNTERGITISQSILEAWAHEKDENQYYIQKAYLEGLTKLDPKPLQEKWQAATSVTMYLLPGEEELIDPLTLSTIAPKEWESIAAGITAWQSKTIELEPVDLEELVLSPHLKAEVKNKKDYKEIKMTAQTGFVSSNLYFPTAHIPQEKLPLMFLYSVLLEQSAKELMPFRGTLDARCMAVESEGSYVPYFNLSILTNEGGTAHTTFLEEARTSLLQRSDEWYKQRLKSFVRSKHYMSNNNVLGTLGQLGWGACHGMRRYLFEQGYPLFKWCQQIDETSGDWIADVKEIDRLLYNKQGAVISHISSQKRKNSELKGLEQFIEALPSYESEKVNYAFQPYERISVLAQDSPVDYVYLQYHEETERLQGSDYVTAAYVSKQYLNPLIRIKQGAYGTRCSVQYPGSIVLYTYRDPDYLQSLEVIKGIPAFLEEEPITLSRFKASQTEAMSKLHEQFKLLGTDLEEAEVLQGQILRGLPEDTVMVLQKEILKTTPQEIGAKASLFKRVIEKGALSIATKKQAMNKTEANIYQFK